MSRTMNSQALVLLDRMLGLSGPGGEQYTTLDDGNVQQVLEIGAIARRSLTFAGSSGLYTVGFRSDADTVANIARNSMNPYNFAASTAAGGMTISEDTNGYPVPVPRGFDVWLIRASAFTSTSAGHNWLQLNVQIPSSSMALRSYAADGGAESQLANDVSNMALARWDTALAGDTLTGSGAAYTWATENGTTSPEFGLRIPRGSRIDFITSAAATGTQAQCTLILGLFPEGLGQDIAT